MSAEEGGCDAHPGLHCPLPRGRSSCEAARHCGDPTRSAPLNSLRLLALGPQGQVRSRGHLAVGLEKQACWERHKNARATEAQRCQAHGGAPKTQAQRSLPGGGHPEVAANRTLAAGAQIDQVAAKVGRRCLYALGGNAGHPAACCGQLMAKGPQRLFPIWPHEGQSRHWI